MTNGHWPPVLDEKLDELAAFDAMRAFLKRYWEICGRPSDTIADVLSDCQRGIWESGMPGDPAMWSDWKAAVKAIQDVNATLGADRFNDPMDEGLD